MDHTGCYEFLINRSYKHNGCKLAMGLKASLNNVCQLFTGKKSEPHVLTSLSVVFDKDVKMKP